MSHYFHDEIDFSFFFFPPLKFSFILGKGCKGRGWKQKDEEMNGIEIHDVKDTKKKIKIKVLKNQVQKINKCA